MLHDLQQAHDRLTAALDALAEVTCDPFPHRVRFTQARFRVSHASLLRRALLGQATDLLLAGARPNEVKALRQLQSAGPETRLESSAHVAKWTSDAIEADWLAYCDASGAMRLRMIAQIDSERRIVYPLLKQRAFA